MIEEWDGWIEDMWFVEEAWGKLGVEEEILGEKELELGLKVVEEELSIWEDKGSLKEIKEDWKLSSD